MIPATQKNFNERGQLAVLLAMIFPMLIMLLAFFVNLSLLIHKKVKLQTAVDVGVYSGAASLAYDLNHIAQLNREINELYQGDPFANKECKWNSLSLKEYLEKDSLHMYYIERKYMQYLNEFQSCLDTIDDINKEAVDKALAFAQEAARWTYYNGKPPAEDPARFEFDTLYKKSGDPMMEYRFYVTTESGEKIVCKKYDKVTCFDFWHDEGKETYTKDVNLPIAKTSPVFFVGQASANVGFGNLWSENFRVAGRHYDETGSGQIRLKTYAAGQPFGGSVAGFDDKYRATLVPIENTKVKVGDYPNGFWH
ncbi:MAG: Tad domain-containing protein [Deltaproteobacteria bacterium]|nr:Tad domain-containing protein [Deltaproteobacteria bacterium]